MKITDLCLIFIAIVLPIIIVVYINVSYTIKAEEQEMYYEQLINSAIEDATNEMKQIENEDKNIDYGYSGENDKKVSISAEIGVKAFFNSLYNNFGIRGNEGAERYLQLFIPVVAVMDYNGVYISSIENFASYNEYTGETEEILEHRIKPKKYFTYTYYVLNSLDKENRKNIVSAAEYNKSTDGGIESVHTVEFSMDDYIKHTGYMVGSKREIPEQHFYLADTNKGSNVEVSGDYAVYGAFRNNTALFANSAGNLSDMELKTIAKIVEHLRDVKDRIIIETITNEIAYSVNSNNIYARNAGIKYDFVFPTIEQEKMGEYINDIGVIAFIQGLSIGNKYLNTEAYSVTRLELVNKYFLSLNNDQSKYKMNLYHISEDCPEYRLYIETKKDNILTPSYVLSKQQAASVVGIYSGKDMADQIVKGFYPCPICNP